MNNSLKYTAVDILTFLGGIAAWLHVFTEIIGFFIALAGAGWWVGRYYNWYRTGKMKSGEE